MGSDPNPGSAVVWYYSLKCEWNLVLFARLYEGFEKSQVHIHRTWVPLSWAPLKIPV